jgi:peptidoglycan/xylan/chitin deacetylase (PgdA/CDA1 family)
MKLIFGLLKYLYPRFVWEIKTEEKKIFLTFDDGPIPEVTEWVLDILSEFNAKATFFCVGENIQKHPEIFEKIVNNGHLVGNHTFKHENGWKTSQNRYLDAVSKCSKLLPPVSGKMLFRPPYGRIKKDQFRALMANYEIVMWTVLTKDYDMDLNPKKCLAMAIKNTKPGAIVLFHDSNKAEKNLKYVLPLYLQYYKELGFEFCALTSIE